MKMISSFDPTATTSGSFDPLVCNPCGKIYLFNESAVGLQLTFQDGSVAGLPPYYFRSYTIAKPGIVQWKQLYTIATGASPLSVVVGEAYESVEAKTVSWTEGPLNRQTSIGNTIPVSTNATSIINDGNAGGTTIVEATQTGSAGSNVLIDNSGNMVVRQWVAATLTNLFQVVANAVTCVLIGAAGKTAEVVGARKVDQTITVIGASSHDNGTITTDGAGNVTAVKNITSSGNIVFTGKKLGIATAGDLLDAATVATQVNLKTTGGDLVFFQGSTEIGRFTNAGNLRVPGGLLGVVVDGDVIDASGLVDTYLKTRNSGGNINFQVPNGSTIASVGSSGLTFQNGKHIQWGSGDTLGITHSLTVNYTGGGSAQTFSHGLSSTPFIVIPILNAAGSATVGVSSITSTQFTMTAGVNGNYKVLCMVG